MKLKFLFITIFAFLVMLARAQSFQGGFSGGLNAARIDGDGQEKYGKLGLNLGAFASREIIRDRLYWQLEVKYTSRGKYNIQKDFSGYPIKIELMDLRYIEVPLSLHYYYNEKIQVELGISPDVLIFERYEIDNDIVPSSQAKDLRRFGITGFIGGNYFILNKLAVGIRFNYSLIPFYKFPGYAIRYRDSGFFHDVLSLNAKYYISRN